MARKRNTHFKMVKPAGWRPGDVIYSLCLPEIGITGYLGTGSAGIKLTTDADAVTCPHCKSKLFEKPVFVDKMRGYIEEQCTTCAGTDCRRRDSRGHAGQRCDCTCHN